MLKYFKNRHVNKELHHFKKRVDGILKRDEDILSDSIKSDLNSISAKVVVLKTADSIKAQKEYHILADKFEKLFPPKRFRIIREYAEILVVALTVAFGVRALYTQPFKIPTSSMQPTLFGIHYVDKSVVPSIPQPLNYLLFSTFRALLTIEQDGSFQGLYPPYNKFLIFPWTSLQIGDVKYNLPGTAQKVAEYCFSKFAEIPSVFPVGFTVCAG